MLHRMSDADATQPDERLQGYGRGHVASSQSKTASGRDEAEKRRALGCIGEDLAATHLERMGFEVLERNVRTRNGEIDIVAFDGKVLAFVEVKTLCARHRAPGVPATRPIEGLGFSQRLRLRRLAAAWLSSESTPRASELRFDAIGVLVDANWRLLSLEHIEGAW